ncbi:MAG: [ribosomal protein S5]-alanine N-acetyltransferase [Gaiellales bacterium]|nr:[ribosomal protein S5]-alanine N-acetyltransferase [Gaiellales bacterium]
MIEQVELRPVRVADAESLARIYSANRTFLAPYDPIRPDGFFTVDGQRRELEQVVQQSAADLRHRFVILADARPVGVLSVSNVVRGVFQSANLGYWVVREMNGQGVGTRAVGAVCRWAFGPGGLHRLEAGTMVDNVASQRVLEKNGFERIGLARDYLHIGGDWRDHILFQRVRS